MAVQAQYPSNILLLNRNGQEGHEYSLQQQPGVMFLDHQSSSVMFNNVGASPNNNNNTNPRKRGREGSITTTATPFLPMNTNSNLFSLQQNQPPQISQPHLIELSQLHNQHPQQVSTGLRLSFGEQQQLQQQRQNLTRTSSSSSSSILSVLATEDFASQIKNQRDELENFLQVQGEQLRRTLAEKRQRHYRALLCAAEESIARRLREKETEIEKATRWNAELEARAAQLCVEAQLWQAKARAQEAAAANLQAQLQQAMVACPSRAGEGGEAEDAESAYVDPDRVGTESAASCKTCRKRVASVVLLPCHHLAVCTHCDRVVQACPVCHALKNSSVEVFLC